MSVTLHLSLRAPQFYPDYVRQGKTRKSAPDVAAHRLGQDEAYLTVREVLFLAQPQMACYRASAAVLPMWVCNVRVNSHFAMLACKWLDWRWCIFVNSVLSR